MDWISSMEITGNFVLVRNAGLGLIVLTTTVKGACKEEKTKEGRNRI